MRIVIESFKPILHENMRTTQQGVSIFRDDTIMTHIKAFRHWFSQQMITQNASNFCTESLFENNFPSLLDIFAKPSSKKSGHAKESKSIFRIENEMDDTETTEDELP